MNNCNWNSPGNEMGDLWDTITSALKKPVQKAIDTNKQKAIDAAVAQASNVAGKTLTKLGANDPKAQAALSKFVGTATQAAQESFMEKNKKLIYTGAALAVLGVGAFIYFSRRRA